MTSACPAPRDLTRFLDGELTENRAAALRAHLGRCSRCAGELAGQRALLDAVAAPVPALRSEAERVAELLARLDAAPSPVPARRRPALAWWSGALAACAAALVAFVSLRSHPAPDRGEFTARGAAVGWARKVGVELWALERGPRRLAPGDALARGVPVVASFSNVDGAPAYLLAFALDARGEVHWLYPALPDAASDPASIRLEGAVVHRALPEAVVMEDVAAGPLRFVLVVTRAPLRASAIDAAAPPDRTPEALRARWPDARVDELDVTYAASSQPEVHP
jgi:anti-sigma factor RsiW